MRKILPFLFFLFLGFTAQSITITFIAATGFWNDPANWDVGAVPTAADDVIIPAGLRCAIPGAFNAFAKSVRINGGGLFNQGNLVVDGTAGDGITLNNGRIDNRGNISVDNVGGHAFLITNGGRVKNRSNRNITLRTNGDDGLHMDMNTLLLNLGNVTVLGPNPNQGVDCSGIILVGPSGRIDVEDTGLGGYYFEGYFENYGIMTASNGIGAIGMRLAGPGNCINRSGGEITIKEPADQGLFQTNGLLTNEAGARIDIFGTGQVSTFSPGLMVGNGLAAAFPVFENYGEVLLHDNLLGTCHGINVYTNGTVINHNGGLIDIDNVTGDGIFSVNLTSNLENRPGGLIEITSVQGRGMTINLDVLNEGSIKIDGTGGNGIDCSGISTDFQNYDQISVKNSGLAGVFGNDHGLFVGGGGLTNHSCGVITLENNVNVNFAASLTNNGFLKTVGTHVNIGTITNNGIIEDYDDGFAGVLNPVVNNAVIVREVPGPLSVGVAAPNFLELGSLVGYSVTFVSVDATGSASAGTYDPVLNTFTPDAAASGLTEVWVKINQLGSGCSDYFRVSIPGGIFLTGDPQEKSIEDEPAAANWQIFPNPTSALAVLQIPDQYQARTVDLSLKDMLGRKVWQAQSIGNAVQEVAFPATAAAGVYWLQISVEGTLLTTERIVLQK